MKESKSRLFTKITVKFSYLHHFYQKCGKNSQKYMVNKWWFGVNKWWLWVNKCWLWVNKCWFLVNKCWFLVNKSWFLVNKSWFLVNICKMLVKKLMFLMWLMYDEHFFYCPCITIYMYRWPNTDTEDTCNIVTCTVLYCTVLNI